MRAVDGIHPAGARAVCGGRELVSAADLRGVNRADIVAVRASRRNTGVSERLFEQVAHLAVGGERIGLRRNPRHIPAALVVAVFQVDGAVRFRRADQPERNRDRAAARVGRIAGNSGFKQRSMILILRRDRLIAFGLAVKPGKAHPAPGNGLGRSVAVCRHCGHAVIVKAGTALTALRVIRDGQRDHMGFPRIEHGTAPGPFHPRSAAVDTAVQPGQNGSVAELLPGCRGGEPAGVRAGRVVRPAEARVFVCRGLRGERLRAP